MLVLPGLGLQPAQLHPGLRRIVYATEKRYFREWIREILMIPNDYGIDGDILTQVDDQRVLIVVEALGQDQILLLVRRENGLGVLYPIRFPQDRGPAVLRSIIFAILHGSRCLELYFLICRLPPLFLLLC
jgi:hypothetical protein